MGEKHPQLSLSMYDMYAYAIQVDLCTVTTILHVEISNLIMEALIMIIVSIIL